MVGQVLKLSAQSSGYLRSGSIAHFSLPQMETALAEVNLTPAFSSLSAVYRVIYWQFKIAACTDLELAEELLKGLLISHV